MIFFAAVMSCAFWAMEGWGHGEIMTEEKNNVKDNIYSAFFQKRSVSWIMKYEKSFVIHKSKKIRGAGMRRLQGAS
jgi:hypothetical protein